MKWSKVAKTIHGESQEPWTSLLSMYKDFQLPCLLSVLKPSISFSAYGQEPFCLNPLHPFLQWCIWCHHKEVGKPLCLAFQAGEDQLSTVHIKSERTVKISLQVYQHLHTAKLPWAGKHSLLCHQPTLGNETTQDQLKWPVALQGLHSLSRAVAVLVTKWLHNMNCISSLGIWKCISSLCPDPNGLTSLPRLHHSHLQQTAGEPENEPPHPEKVIYSSGVWNTGLNPFMWEVSSFTFYRQWRTLVPTAHLYHF